MATLNCPLVALVLTLVQAVFRIVGVKLAELLRYLRPVVNTEAPTYIRTRSLGRQITKHCALYSRT